MDDNKLFILEMLAQNEATIQGFLDRLEELRTIITEKENDYSAKLILSTVHSSKGLEYSNVILIDVINGVFPSKMIKNFKTALPSEKRDYEEERRIFYVGMTRAKDKLTIFKYGDAPSIFVGELIKGNKAKTGTGVGSVESGVRETASIRSVNRAKAKIRSSEHSATTMLLKKKAAPVTSGANVPENLVMGERVYQERYGEGVISDVTWDEDEIPTKFTVEFDDGSERKFIYPFAFTTGMKILEE